MMDVEEREKLVDFIFYNPVEEERDEKGAESDSKQELDNDERKKRLLKIDHELMEFEERGGFARILQDIF